jgi:hypothetical protein
MSGTLYFKDLRIIKKTYDTVGQIGAVKKIPQSFSLSQNYPNPFNAYTTIEYTIAKPGYTELILYDILGKRVFTLVQKSHNIGRYSISLDATHMASGIYIYRLSSGDTHLMRKMMLVK